MVALFGLGGDGYGNVRRGGGVGTADDEAQAGFPELGGQGGGGPAGLAVYEDDQGGFIGGKIVFGRGGHGVAAAGEPEVQHNAGNGIGAGRLGGGQLRGQSVRDGADAIAEDRAIQHITMDFAGGHRPRRGGRPDEQTQETTIHVVLKLPT